MNKKTWFRAYMWALVCVLVSLILYAGLLPDVIADGCAVTHLKAERLIVGLHLFEGREDVNLCIPACPVAANANHFTDAFVVAQVDDITDTDLRQKIADALNRLASKMTTDKFIDGGKSELLDSALKDIQEEMTPIGIQVMSLSYVGKPEYPPTVIDSINAKVTANQKTLQREQEVKQREAEANMLRAEAAGQADAIRTKAQAEADAIRLRGEALRQNPGVMELEAINKWNGTLPQYMTSNTAVPFVPVK